MGSYGLRFVPAAASRRVALARAARTPDVAG